MQKKKLDLNQLLAKYEGVSNPSDSPPRERNHQRIEEEFYQHPAHSKTMQDAPVHDKPFTATQQPTRSTHSNFAMSKSEVEAYLLSLKDEVRSEERQLVRSSDSALKTLHQNFQKSVQKIRRELTEALNRAFQDVQKAVREELQRQTKNESPEITALNRRIAVFDQQIDRLISGLRGAEYRKIIAEVVTRDFSLELNELKSASSTARNFYTQSLGEVEVDRSKIDVIREQVQKLFFVNRKNSVGGNLPVRELKEESSGLFGMFKDKSEPPVAQSRARKSFFNFGGD